jgi:peroxiredoxin
MKKIRILLIVVLVTIVVWTIYDAFSKKEDSAHSLGQGAKAPDFQLPDLYGETLALSDVKGKKVVLNFWATWCPPCRVEMPDMQELSENYPDELVILAVNQINSEARGTETVKSFVQDFGLTFPILIDEGGEVASMYRVRSLPTSYLIDSEGIIRHMMIGPMSYDWMRTMLNQMN